MTSSPLGVIEAALERATKISEKLNHGFVGPEHILLAVLQDSNEPVSQVLGRLGITYQAVLDLELPLPEPTTLRPLSETAHQLIPRIGDLAAGQDVPVSPAHIILALITANDPVINELWTVLGKQPDDIEAAVRRLLTEDPAEPVLSPATKLEGTRVTIAQLLEILTMLLSAQSIKPALVDRFIESNPGRADRADYFVEEYLTALATDGELQLATCVREVDALEQILALLPDTDTGLALGDSFRQALTVFSRACREQRTRELLGYIGG